MGILSVLGTAAGLESLAVVRVYSYMYILLKTFRATDFDSCKTQVLYYNGTGNKGKLTTQQASSRTSPFLPQQTRTKPALGRRI